jgi:hypothetical protein
MSITRSIALTGAAIVIVAGASVWATAQVPAKPTILRVAAKGPPSPAETRRPAPKFVPRPEAPKQVDTVVKPGAEVLISRETYSYPGIGRRDPFVSLMNTEELRPLLNDLKLVAVAFDPSGRNSVAVLRDVTTKEQYRVKVGQEIGRMRVASIREKDVVFGIEEFGYSRQESLAMTTDSTKVRTQ